MASPVQVSQKVPFRWHSHCQMAGQTISYHFGQSERQAANIKSTQITFNRLSVSVPEVFGDRKLGSEKSTALAPQRHLHEALRCRRITNALRPISADVADKALAASKAFDASGDFLTGEF